MGMFDYVRCEYPLPGLDDPSVFDFQTKDTDEQYLETYVITKDGRLTLKDVDQNFHGQLDIGWSNVVAGGPGVYTRNGEDAWYLDFTLIFTDGTVSDVKEVANTKESALASSEMRLPEWMQRTQEEIRERKARENESLIGQRKLVWWGGDTSKPYWVKVIAENDRDYCVQSEEDGRFESIPRCQRDNTFFDSMEDGKAERDGRKRAWEDARREYDEKIAAKSH